MRQDYNAIKQKNKFFRKGIQVPQSSHEPHQNSSHFHDLTQSRAQTPFKTFQLPKQNIIQVVSILEWRCQTSLPIIKVAEYTVEPETDLFSQKTTFRSSMPANMKSNKLSKTNKLSQSIRQYVEFNPDVTNYKLKVRHEEIKHQLKNIGHLPFSQALQLLKEMLIGFQALYDCFRSFQVSQDLIAVNSNDQWCMWIDKDYCNNMKTQCKITQKQLIYKLIAITQKHSLQTIQSRHFFGAAKESTFSNDCSFIRMLEKLNQFITANKIYLVNKITFPKENDGVKHEASNLAKNALRRFVTNNQAEIYEKIKRRKQSAQTIYFHSKSATNLFKPITHNQSSMISYPSCAEITADRFRKNTITQVSTPTTMNYLSHVFMPLEEFIGADKKNNQDSSLSIRLNPSPKKKPAQQNRNCNQIQINHHGEGLNTSYSNTHLPNQVFYLSRPKYFKKNEALAHQKPVSQLNQPAKRANIRKYSEQLIKLKSADSLNKKRFQNSTICQKQDEINLQQADVSRPQPSHIQARQASSSSQDIILSSPNNSSSTKQIRNSGQMDNDGQRSPYKSMKMKDLAPHRKNNQSSINNYNLNDQRDKNMSASYQMMRIDGRSDSQSSESNKHKQLQQPNWINKISDLFSDTKSIKQLKGSIRMKTFDDEYFEKDHLKDIKLDMLDKFGRSVTLHCDEEGDHHPKQTPKHNQYKSMQLIEEQMDQVKSYQEEQRRDDEVTVKSIRSRRQTQGYADKQREISFKDEFIVQQNQSGFNFQTEHYNIRARRGS